MFGPALRGDYVSDSDLDLLAQSAPQTTLMDIDAIRLELKKLLGMEVDVLTPNDLPANYVSRFTARPGRRDSRRPAAPCRHMRHMRHMRHIIEVIQNITTATRAWICRRLFFKGFDLCLTPTLFVTTPI